MARSGHQPSLQPAAAKRRHLTLLGTLAAAAAVVVVLTGALAGHCRICMQHTCMQRLMNMYVCSLGAHTLAPLAG